MRDTKINIDEEENNKKAISMSSPTLASLSSNPNYLPTIACLLYSLASISMTLSNKAMFQTFHFNFPIFTLMWQNVFTIALMYVLERLGYITFKELKKDIAQVWLPVNLLFILMLVSGAYAIKFLTVPMITVFKNLSTVMTTYADAHVTNQEVPQPIAISCLLIVLSSIAAGYSDLSFNLTGYLVMGFNCVITTAYLIYMKSVSSRNPATKNYLDSWTMTYYNSVISLPFLLPLAWSFGETVNLQADLASRNEDLSFWTFMLWMGFIGLGMSACSLWAMKTTNPSTYGIVGSLNKIPLAIAGVAFFNVPLTPLSAASILLGLGAGILYSWAKTQAAKQPPPPPPPSSEEA
ncbi:hypothetical protein PROFUN_12017 [Planoprotostelium fungivorum]|uniref:Sugar phosphate transporter domain-containing protein n=1 Tax=Planoprotostelium fungivorum TaxID=1890364 RepID=A0A2P6MRD8_9EUKA|nr:hypothetical protein PROFUN_12017 [Planoprotostelium fungivorum]